MDWHNYENEYGEEFEKFAQSYHEMTETSVSTKGKTTKFNYQINNLSRETVKNILRQF